MKYFIQITFLFCTSLFVHGKEVVHLYTYHNKAPFITDLKNEKGLSFDIAKTLSKYSGKFEYKTLYIPRKRLDGIKKKKIVLWSNPGWVKDLNQKKFLWSKKILSDSDILIYRKTNELIYKSIADLSGRSLVCVRGYFYPDLNFAFKSLDTERVNVNSEVQVLKMIKAQRKGIGVISLSTYRYLTERGELSRKNIKFIKGPMKSFSRHIFTSKDMTLAFRDMESLFVDKSVERSLKLSFQKYGLYLKTGEVK